MSVCHKMVEGARLHELPLHYCVSVLGLRDVVGTGARSPADSRHSGVDCEPPSCLQICIDGMLLFKPMDALVVGSRNFESTGTLELWRPIVMERLARISRQAEEAHLAAELQSEDD